MSPPPRPNHPTDIEGLNWLVTDDGSLTLWDHQLQESYHSGCGAIAESLVVYLVNSGVLDRIVNGHATRVFEVGLGTGTNFLLTAAVADFHKTPLEYWAIEKRLLPSVISGSLNLLEHLPRALCDNRNVCLAAETESNLYRPIRSRPAGILSKETFRSLANLSREFSKWMDQLNLAVLTNAVRPSPDSKGERLDHFQPLQRWNYQLTDNIEIHLLVGDALNFSTCDLGEESENQYHAVYFDPFSPESNPELWTDEFLHSMFRILQASGTLTSYCVKSDIRRRLASIGFEVQKIHGPVGGKREVLRAVKSVAQASFP